MGSDLILGTRIVKTEYNEYFYAVVLWPPIVSYNAVLSCSSKISEDDALQKLKIFLDTDCAKKALNERYELLKLRYKLY